MKKLHTIKKVIFKKSILILENDGKEYQFNLADISKRLAKATQSEKEKYEISLSGYGIHWPLIDEDLSIDGLLNIKHAPNKQKQRIAV